MLTSLKTSDEGNLFETVLSSHLSSWLLLAEQETDEDFHRFLVENIPSGFTINEVCFLSLSC